MLPVRIADRLPRQLRPLSIVVLCGVFGLGSVGCAVGPDYQRPATPLSEFHGAAAVVSRSASAPPSLDRWWSGFNDPELSRIVERVLAQNLDLAAALARVQQARASAREAGAQLSPAVTA